MKNHLGRLLSLLFLFLVSSSLPAGAIPSRPPQQDFVPGEIIVQFKAEALTRSLAAGVHTTGLLPSIP